ncbi:hypothetical protein FIBSPDRAFT_1042902 [Athelia psychrophila]|uniref:Stress-response A/B barrel domain-containing protein n=1 Tax=Athelia psychrophila TaxID=1759441 RepID=A0A166LYN0_9AGAM|nr:hypothetical protein FIBSPDRAFT_1042902 [Fibularhizoctonia sp. CBS 109695]
MSVLHIMAYTWLEDVPEEQQKRLRQEVLDLPRNCMRNGQKYIIGINAGPPLMAGLKYDYIYMVEFSSNEDRDYFVKSDPLRQKLAAELDENVFELFLSDLGGSKWREV